MYTNKSGSRRFADWITKEHEPLWLFTGMVFRLLLWSYVVQKLLDYYTETITNMHGQFHEQFLFGLNSASYSYITSSSAVRIIV